MIKKIRYGILVSLVMIPLLAHSQFDCGGRYQDTVFNQIDTVLISYGVAPNWNFTPQVLEMLIFKPSNDTLSNRPVILFVPGGAFHVCSVWNGHAQSFCHHFARLGYVCVSVSYRVGMPHPTNEYQTKRTIYRAVQDVRSAVRYIKGNAALYKIDPDKVFLAGYSAGGSAALMATYYDQNDFDDSMILSGLGGLDEIGGYPTISSDVKAVIACGAMVLDTSLIGDSEIPAILMHGAMDPSISALGGHVESVDYHGGLSVHQYLGQHGNSTLKYVTGYPFHLPSLVNVDSCYAYFGDELFKVMAGLYPHPDLQFDNGNLWLSGGAELKWYKESQLLTATDSFFSPSTSGRYYVEIPFYNECLFRTDTIQLLDSLFFVQQNIGINNGWNMVSTFIDVEGQGIADLLSPIENSLIIAKNELGSVYWPQYGVNLIDTLINAKAYYLNMNSADSLTVEGIALDPAQFEVVLFAGWNYLGYLRQNVISTTSGLAGITSLLIAKDHNGLVYWPLFNVDQIQELLPGRGYLVKTGQAESFFYPSN